MLRVLARGLIVIVLPLIAGNAHAQSAGRLIEEVGTSGQDDYVAVTILFTCSVRYVSHSPASSGDVVRVRLVPQPDCGASEFTSSAPPALDDLRVIRSVDVAQTFGRDVELTIRWSQPEQFVLISSFDGRGLKIRLLREPADRSKVMVQEVGERQAALAVNLESSKTPFDTAAIDAAGAVTGVRTYVSEAMIDGEKWYRLRAGPFVTEADAKRVLQTARSRYPKAWLAVGDDTTLNTIGLPDAVDGVAPTRSAAVATLTPAEIDRTYKAAREAFRKKDYPKAIELLTKLVTQPEFPQRAASQEMLGLARERSGQLAHAKAEYEEYLRRYPQGEAAKRTRKRLQTMVFESTPGNAGRKSAASDESPWRFIGGMSQFYRRDTSSFDNGTDSNDQTTQDAVLTDVGLVARRRGERFDFSSKVSAGYAYDLLPDGPGNQTRVTQLFAEVVDRQLDWSARVGRQSGSAGGLLGIYDGVYAGYRVLPRLRVNAHFGYPVESTREGPSTDRDFYALSADIGTFANAFDFSVYAISQSYFGLEDRQALGTELHYFRPGRTLVARVDYDINFQEINDILLLGTIELPARWTMSVNLDHRMSPSLAMGNALIGQPVDSFDELFGLYTDDEIEQLARDRTAQSDTYTVSFARPFGEHWYWSTDLSSITVDGTPASGGVQETPDSGADFVVSTQAMGYGLFGRGDVSSIGLQYQTSDALDVMSLGLSSQFPLGAAWRIGPRLRLDQRHLQFDGSDQTVISPGLRVELQWKRFHVELEGGTEIGQRDVGDASEDTTRYYLSLGYRYDF